MTIDSHSLERLVPDEIRQGDTTGAETLELHLARYAFAAEHLKPDRVLDIACGVGYGTALLAGKAPDGTEVIGVDLSEDAIAYAREHYTGKATRFETANAMTFSDPDGFDTIVSLETIEHLPDPRGFIAHLTTLLRPGGILIASVPTTPSVDANPHHATDFSPRSFRRLFVQQRLAEIDCLHQIQPFRPLPLLARTEARARDLRRNLPLFYLTHPMSFVRRIASTLRHGFANHYTTIAWQAPA